MRFIGAHALDKRSTAYFHQTLYHRVGFYCGNDFNAAGCIVATHIGGAFVPAV